MKDHLAWVTDAKTKEEAMTTKVSDERLADIIRQISAYESDNMLQWARDKLTCLRELETKRALVKECEEYLRHRQECDRVFFNEFGRIDFDCARPCTCGLDALLARVRGET